MELTNKLMVINLGIIKPFKAIDLV